MTGLAPDFAVENVGFFTAPYGERSKLGKPVIDRANQAVDVTLPDGVTRTAKYLRQPGLRHAPGRPERREFHPGRRQEPIARSLDPAMANGRRPAARAAAAGDRRRETRSCR
jgi:hypothetical protein